MRRTNVRLPMRRQMPKKLAFGMAMGQSVSASLRSPSLCAAAEVLSALRCSLTIASCTMLWCIRSPILPCMCANVRLAARALTQRYDEALLPLGPVDRKGYRSRSGICEKLDATKQVSSTDCFAHFYSPATRIGSHFPQSEGMKSKAEPVTDKVERIAVDCEESVNRSRSCAR